jgi:hypothetical protein
MWNETKSQVTSQEKVSTYHMLMVEAIFELLVEKGVLRREELLERIEMLRRITRIIVQDTH